MCLHIWSDILARYGNVSNVLYSLHIEADEGVHDLILLNFLQHLNISHNYNNYKHLAQTYTNIMQITVQGQRVAKAMTGCLPKATKHP